MMKIFPKQYNFLESLLSNAYKSKELEYDSTADKKPWSKSKHLNINLS